MFASYLKKKKYFPLEKMRLSFSHFCVALMVPYAFCTDECCLSLFSSRMLLLHFPLLHCEMHRERTEKKDINRTKGIRKKKQRSVGGGRRMEECLLFLPKKKNHTSLFCHRGFFGNSGGWCGFICVRECEGPECGEYAY